MASPCSSFLYAVLRRWHLTARLLVDGGCDADDFLSSRHDELTNQRNLQVTKTCDAGLEQDAKEGEMLCSHEMISYVPRLILDSGACHHVVGDASLLSSFTTITPADSAAAYQARDGRLLTVVGAGTISSDHFHLDNVLYIPDLRTKVVLVSVPQLAERGYLVMLGSGQCSVKHQSSGEIVGKGRLHGDDSLYHLEFIKLLPDTADATDAPASATDSMAP